MKENNPQIPNPEQLAFIHPKSGRTNAARYEEAPQELKAESPTVIIGPNATYLVQAGYWPDKVEGIGPEEPANAPVISSLEPNELPVWAQDTEVIIHGTGFTEGSIINWNGGDEATTFIEATKVSTIVKPSTVQAPLPFTLSVYVSNGEERSNELPFSFIT